jgi:cytochrome c-type biogenesis protein
MNALVYSSSLAAAFLGGILALFAPCCIVSVLPTFVGAALERGRLHLPLSAGIFAAGIATVMLPIVLGIGLLGQLLAAHHREVFFVVGMFLVLLSLQVFSGRPWTLPLPMLRLRVSGSTPPGIYALGVASGFASSCCAPVLAGVAVMSALAGSALGALGLGLAYVFGMVFPLLVAVIFWDRLQLRLSLHRFPRFPRLRVGERKLPWPEVVAGAMFLVVGGLALYIAYTGQNTYLPDWLTVWNRWATDLAGRLAVGLGRMPLWFQAALLAGLAAALGGALYASWRADVKPRNPATAVTPEEDPAGHWIGRQRGS